MEGINDVTQEMKHIFYSQNHKGYGYLNFMRWDDVLDPKKGFIKNDTVIFLVKMKADLPNKISANCQDHETTRDEKSITEDLSTKVADPTDCIVKDLTSLEEFVTELKEANKTRNEDRIECLLILIRGKISVLKSIQVEYVTEWMKRPPKEALELAEIEVKNAENFLKSKKNTSVDLSSDASSSTIRIDWKPVPFCGDEDEWCQWWKIFEPVVDTNEAIDDDVKMKALTECLKGEANDILGDMPRTGKNYRRAVALLQNQYGDAAALSQTYYKQLECLTPARNLKSQRQTVNKLRQILQNLDDLRGRLAVDDQVIIRNIVQRFPAEVFRLALHGLSTTNHETGIHPTPAELLEALERYLQIEEFVAAYEVAIDKSKGDQ